MRDNINRKQHSNRFIPPPRKREIKHMFEPGRPDKFKNMFVAVEEDLFKPPALYERQKARQAKRTKARGIDLYNYGW